MLQIPYGKDNLEFADNRISRYSMQLGKCAVTGGFLTSEKLHCHHKLPRHMGGTDEFSNLVIIKAVDFALEIVRCQRRFARISYFAVDKDIRSIGIGREIEEYCTNLANKRNCDRIEVHCHSRRIDAHRFYIRQGFTESPKYFVKMLPQSD